MGAKVWWVTGWHLCPGGLRAEGLFRFKMFLGQFASTSNRCWLFLHLQVIAHVKIFKKTQGKLHGFVFEHLPVDTWWYLINWYASISGIWPVPGSQKQNLITSSPHHSSSQLTPTLSTLLSFQRRKLCSLWSLSSKLLLPCRVDLRMAWQTHASFGDGSKLGVPRNIGNDRNNYYIHVLNRPCGGW